MAKALVLSEETLGATVEPPRASQPPRAEPFTPAAPKAPKPPKIVKAPQVPLQIRIQRRRRQGDQARRARSRPDHQ